VNAWLTSNPLPAEYTDLEISHVPPWEPLDTLMLGKGSDAQFNAGYELWDTPVLESYEAAGEQAGFDGRALFFEDLTRVSPTVLVATVPDAGGGTPFAFSSSSSERERPLAPAVRKDLPEPDAIARVQELARVVARRGGAAGSNVWGVAAWASAEGVPMIANDSHVELTAPAKPYEIHLVVEGDPVFEDLNLSGTQSPGAPGVLTGQSQFIAWGGTAFFGDVSDTFRDRLIRGDQGCAARLCIESAGELHPVEERSEIYRMNSLGNSVLDDTIDMTSTIALLAPEAVNVLSVPFRSFGPIVDVTDRGVVDDPGSTPAETTVLTLQYSGLHGTRIGEALFGFMTARNVTEFGEAVRLFAATVKNWAVADTNGDLAYFTSGDIPLRADLEAGHVVGNQPWLVRDGSGSCNWVRDPLAIQGQDVPPYSQGQTLPFLTIPSDEMPAVVNPASGFVVNANNDPSGTNLDNDLVNQFRSSGGIYYLGPAFVLGFRAGRITELLESAIGAGGKVSLEDMKRLQANTQQLDAELMTPFLLEAYANAERLAAPAELANLASDPRIAEAVSRLAAWDFSTPTGIPEGYDAADLDGVRDPVVSPGEAAHSVAATLYNVWRLKLISNVIIGRLRDFGLTQNFTGASFNGLHHLLSREPFTGVGASGIDFFPEPAALPVADRRDLALLQALRDALDALAGNAFASAFANSTNQDDYRWGKLNRVMLEHPLGGLRSIPPAAGFTDLSPQLGGMARDGGYATVNPGGQAGAGLTTISINARAFEFSDGSEYRRVLAPSHPLARPDGVLGFANLAGGSSGDSTSPLYASQLGKWLTVDYHRVPMNSRDVRVAAERVELFTAAAP
jgi:penicillin amidase